MNQTGRLKEFQWLGEPKKGTPPMPRSGHTVTAYAGCLYVLGGLADSERREAFGVMVNDCYEYNPRTQLWRFLPLRGPLPKVFGHTSVLWGSELVVFGGQEQNCRATNMTTTIQLDESHQRALCCEPLQCELSPSGRWGHSATLVGDCCSEGYGMLIFGGMDYEFGTKNDAWLLRLGDRKWKWQEINAGGGGAPPPRRRHTCCVYGHWMYIFGGRNRSVYYNDVWRLNLATLLWELVCPVGPAHVPSYLLSPSQMCQIRQLEQQGKYLPAPRTGHSAYLHDSNWYIFGGFEMVEEEDFSKKKFNLFNDLHCFDMQSHKWTLKHPNTSLSQDDVDLETGWGHKNTSELQDGVPLKRSMADVAAIGQRLYLFGGRDHHGAFNTFVSMVLPDKDRSSLVSQCCAYVTKHKLDYKSMGLPSHLEKKLDDFVEMS